MRRNNGSRSRRAAVVTVLSAAALVAALAAQHVRPVFRGGVAHVVVDVVVTDRDDQPVTDLTQAEFRISDEGRLQTITDFELVSVPLSDRTIDLRAVPAPAPDVASNARPPRTSRAIAFILDDLTIQGQDIVPAKRLMTEFLRTLSPEDLVAITYVKRSDLGQDFTSDAWRLIAAVNNMPAAIGGPNQGALRETLFVLKNVASALGGAPQARRAIVYVSSGYATTFTRGGLSNLSASALIGEVMEEVYTQARQRGIPIYTVDPRGLADPESVFGIGAINSSERRSVLAKRIQAEQFFMQSLASGTGGRGFVNQSDLIWTARQIVAENGSYYVVGYSPAPYRPDGEFHDVKVTVTRPGLRVRARAGYVAEKPRPATTSPATLRKTLEDGVAGGDLQLRAFAAPVGPTRRGAGVALTVDVAYPPRTEAQPAKDRLHIAWTLLDPDAGIRASGTRTVETPIGEKQSDAFTLSLQDYLEIPRGKHVLRVAVASELLATSGTVHLPIDVPQLAGRPLAVGGILLGLESATAPALRAARLDSTNASGVPFPPTTRREFSTTDRLHVFARIFAARPADVRTEILLTRDGQTVRSLAPQMAPAAVPAGAIDCQAPLPLADLAPGTYAIEWIVRAGAERVTRAVGFVVK